MMENNIAKVKWNEQEGRHELRILNILKAYTTGADRAEHDAAKPELCKLASDKGYTVIEA